MKEVRFAMGECYLGKFLVASTTVGLCAVLLSNDDEELVKELQAKFPNMKIMADADGLRDVLDIVSEFVEASGSISILELPLDLKGTEFQKRVWQALRDVPVGETRTYSEIAHLIGAPKSFRAVATACGANKLAVVIPCHRIVAKDGGLSGYRWGVERKRMLLEREQLLE